MRDSSCNPTPPTLLGSLDDTTAMGMRYKAGRPLCGRIMGGALTEGSWLNPLWV